MCTKFQTSSSTALYFQPSPNIPNDKTNPRHSNSRSTRSHTSTNAALLSVPEWNDQYDSSITTASAITLSAPTILYDGSSSLPNEVYIPVPAGANSNPAEPATISQQPGGSTPRADGWSAGNLTSKRLDDFAIKILPKPVQIHMAQPFGNDSIRHSFYSEKCLRHVLLPRPLKVDS